MSDREVKRLQSKLDLMKARGTSAEEQTAQRKKILDEEKKFADAQAEKYANEIASMIDILKAQITAEKKNNRKLFLGAGIGAALVGVLVVVFR